MQTLVLEMYLKLHLIWYPTLEDTAQPEHGRFEV